MLTGFDIFMVLVNPYLAGIEFYRLPEDFIRKGYGYPTDDADHYNRWRESDPENIEEFLKKFQTRYNSKGTVTILMEGRDADDSYTASLEALYAIAVELNQLSKEQFTNFEASVKEITDQFQYLLNWFNSKEFLKFFKSNYFNAEHLKLFDFLMNFKIEMPWCKRLLIMMNKEVSAFMKPVVEEIASFLNPHPFQNVTFVNPDMVFRIASLREEQGGDDLPFTLVIPDTSYPLPQINRFIVESVHAFKLLSDIPRLSGVNKAESKDLIVKVMDNFLNSVRKSFTDEEIPYYLRTFFEFILERINSFNDYSKEPFAYTSKSQSEFFNTLNPSLRDRYEFLKDIDINTVRLAEEQDSLCINYRKICKLAALKEPIDFISVSISAIDYYCSTSRIGKTFRIPASVKYEETRIRTLYYNLLLLGRRLLENSILIDRYLERDHNELEDPHMMTEIKIEDILFELDRSSAHEQRLKLVASRDESYKQLLEQREELINSVKMFIQVLEIDHHYRPAKAAERKPIVQSRTLLESPALVVANNLTAPACILGSRALHPFSDRPYLEGLNSEPFDRLANISGINFEELQQGFITAVGTDTQAHRGISQKLRQWLEENPWTLDFLGLTACTDPCEEIIKITQGFISKVDTQKINLVKSVWNSLYNTEPTVLDMKFREIVQYCFKENKEENKEFIQSLLFEAVAETQTINFYNTDNYRNFVNELIEEIRKTEFMESHDNVPIFKMLWGDKFYSNNPILYSLLICLMSKHFSEVEVKQILAMALEQKLEIYNMDLGVIILQVGQSATGKEFLISLRGKTSEDSIDNLLKFFRKTYPDSDIGGRANMGAGKFTEPNSTISFEEVGST
ncbi:MAG: hypothetical protein SFU25_10555 [Candidatus Caenarcaniphilales bacterium]|nr:hypothetical protein [Candidatus Caenarcaniphilales bacterium]